MKLSTGKIAFPIEFDNGDKDTIYFNPNDPSLALRLKDFSGIVGEKLKAFENIDSENIEDLEQYREMLQIIYDELDKAFDSEISNVVFKHCSPIAFVNGDFFIMQFVEAITPEIEKVVKKANADAEKKMQKHIAKYSK